MKILLIEDDDLKSQAIIAHLKERDVAESDIIHAKNMTDFAAYLSYEIGLFIIDFKVPNLDSGSAIPNGKVILESIVKAGKNDAHLLAISSYPADFPELRDQFEAQGCILADYRNTTGWKSTLDHLITQLKKNIRFDFLIFCALKDERRPYSAFIDGRAVNRAGINFLDFEIDKARGAVVLLPQMGLVNAATVAATCIDRYKPKLVAMSGICGGFKDRTELGQLLVSKMAYEYQSGKWSDDGFQNDPYQVPTDAGFVSFVELLLDQEDLLEELEKGFKGGDRPSKQTPPAVGIFTSGSAVIANQEYMDQIQVLHRKVNGLDMEVFAIQRAAELSTSKPLCLCAKVVVDLCNSEKGDKIHQYGSYVSAKFVLKTIAQHFSQA
ncbi:MAG: nucleoside phosphorylase [Gammaproteobacteria bacterium]